jgi:dipeptidyl aminopeptidase/acylaminoacyl peptidase
VNKKSSPFGHWESSLTPALIANKLKLPDVQYTTDSLLWLEGRPDCSALVLEKSATTFDLDSSHQPRGGLGYGGGEFHARGCLVVFVDKDGRLYRTSTLQNAPNHPITPGFGSSSTPTISPDGQNVLFLHSDGKDDSIGLVDLTKPAWPTRLVYGADFYMQPTWRPDGKTIAWVEWNAPQMSWDGALIKTAQFDPHSKSISNIQTMAGDPSTPVFQPEFSPDGRFLSYIQGAEDTDELVLLDLASGAKKIALQGEILIQPAWLMGQRVYGWSSDSTSLFVICQKRGAASILEVDAKGAGSKELLIPAYSTFSQISMSPSRKAFACIASSPLIPARAIEWENGTIREIRRSVDLDFSPHEISIPQPVSWQNQSGETVFGFYYPPLNAHFTSAGLPPAIIHIHGGPTSQADTSFSFDAEFFTNRGYAMLMVNYRGSSGYGRKYQQALNRQWGEFDVEDAISAVQFLIDNRLANPDQIVLKGGSAGGYTLLNALARHPAIFRAAVCSYPVANLMTIIAETFKFEAHYYDSLIGPYPKEKQKYFDWSPINHVNSILTPMLLFHGDSDPVVPPSQSAEIAAALSANSVPHRYHVFAGEGHGWRNAETLETYYSMIEQFLIDFVLNS